MICNNLVAPPTDESTASTASSNVFGSPSTLVPSSSVIHADGMGVDVVPASMSVDAVTTLALEMTVAAVAPLDEERKGDENVKAALAGHSPNKASAALTLSSLFRSSSSSATAATVVSSANVVAASVDTATATTSTSIPSAFITPLEKSSYPKRQTQISSIVTDSIETTIDDRAIQGAFDPQPNMAPLSAKPTIVVTAPVNKKARVSKQPSSTSKNAIPHYGDQNAMHGLQPFYGYYGQDGYPQMKNPTCIDKTHLNKPRASHVKTSKNETESPPLAIDGHDFTAFNDVPYTVTQPQFFATPQGFVQYYPAGPMNPTEQYYSHPTHIPMGGATSSHPAASTIVMVPVTSSPPNMHRSTSQSNLNDTAPPILARGCPAYGTEGGRVGGEPNVASPLNGILSINSTQFSPPPLSSYAPYGHPQAKSGEASLPPLQHFNGSSGCVMVPHAVYYYHGNPMNSFGRTAGNQQWMPPNPAFYIPTTSIPPDSIPRTKIPKCNASFVPIASFAEVESTAVIEAKSPTRKKTRPRKSKPKVATKVPMPSPFDHSNFENMTFYNRKEKSLGLLSENFIAIFSSLPPATTFDAETSSTIISIDQAAAHLGVERRRIYDIVNVLESLKIVSRKCKNTYYWHGTQDLMDTFADLQEEALFGNMIVFNSSLDGNRASTSFGQGPSGYGIEEALRSGMIPASTYLGELQSVYMGCQERHDTHEMTMSDGCINVGSSNAHAKCKTLAKLSQRFVQYFLMGHVEVSLIDSSEHILGYFAESSDINQSQASDSLNEAEGQKSHRDLTTLKSKIRRLYDVANVFTSLKIIEKKNTGNNFSSVESCRPSFKWCWDLSPREILDRRISTKTTRTLSMPDAGSNRR